jgi:phytoene/squalene synthetase
MSDSGQEGDSMWPARPTREFVNTFVTDDAGEEDAHPGRARIDAEITRAQLVRAAQLLAHVGQGPTRSIRAAFAGEARDTYEAAMRRLERLRGTQAEESLKLDSLRVRLLLEEAERGHTLLPPPAT